MIITIIFLQSTRETHPFLAPYVGPVLIISCFVLLITWIKINRKINRENKKKNYLINVSKITKKEALQQNDMLFKMLKDDGPSKVSGYFFREFDLEVEPTHYHIKSYLVNTKRIIEQQLK